MFENNQKGQSSHQEYNNHYPKSSFNKNRQPVKQEELMVMHSEQSLPPQHRNSSKYHKKTFMAEIHTPEFSQKFDPFIMNMSEYESSSGIQNIISSNSRNKESVIEINQSLDDYPYTTQKLNINFQKNLLRMLVLKTRNNVEEVRVIRQQFLSYIREVQSLIEYFKEKIIMQVQDHFKSSGFTSSKSKPLESHYEQLFKENQIYVSNLQHLLDTKNQELYHMQKKLQAQVSKNNNNASNSHSSKDGKTCYNCQILNLKINTLKGDNDHLKAQVERLLAQNQVIYEEKFDLEQNIAGIDLQVERRLKEEVKMLAMPLDRASIQKQNNDYLFIINRLNEQNAQIQRKCSYYQTITVKEGQLIDRQNNLKQKQQRLRLKEDSLLESVQNIQRLKQKLNAKENELIVAQQNLNKMRNTSSDRFIKNNEEKYKENGFHDAKRYSNNYLKEKEKENLTNLSRQSLQSFGNFKLADNQGLASKGYRNRSQQEMNIYENERNEQIEIPMLHLRDNKNRSFQLQDSFETKLSKIPFVQAEDYRNMAIHTSKLDSRGHHEGNMSKYQSQVPYKGSTRLPTTPLERSHYSKYNMESQGTIKTNHNHNTSTYGQALQKRNSPINYRQTSKNSRTSSNKKGFGNYLSNSQLSRMGKGYGNSHSNNNSNKRSGNVLGSKLQKLRQEIKRQIDSIN